MRALRATAAMALTFAASMSLQACQTLPKPSLGPPVVVELKDQPSSDLLICPSRPQGFPTDQAAFLEAPQAVRLAAERIAEAFGTNADQLSRLINWLSPGACN